MSISASTIASTENRMIFGLRLDGALLVGGVNVMAFHAIDTREALAAEAVAWPEMEDVSATFGEPTPDAADDFTELIVSPGIPLEHPWWYARETAVVEFAVILISSWRLLMPP